MLLTQGIFQHRGALPQHEPGRNLHIQSRRNHQRHRHDKGERRTLRKGNTMPQGRNDHNGIPQLLPAAHIRRRGRKRGHQSRRLTSEADGSDRHRRQQADDRLQKGSHICLAARSTEDGGAFRARQSIITRGDISDRQILRRKRKHGKPEESSGTPLHSGREAD